MSRCKACHCALSSAPRKSAHKLIASKVCRRCRVERPATSEHWHSAKKGLGGFASKCRDCQNAMAAAAKEKNVEEVRRWNRWFSSQPEVRARATERRHADPEAYRAWQKRFRDKNRDRYREMMRAGKATRKARKAANGGRCTVADIEKMKSAQGGLCRWCRQPYGRFHVDHVIPIARGGSSDPSNLVLSCSRCNQRRGSKLVEEWEGGPLTL